MTIFLSRHCFFSIGPSHPAFCLIHMTSVCFPSRGKRPNRTWYHTDPKPSKCLSAFLPLSLPCSCMERAQQCFHNKHNRSFLCSAFSPLFITSVNTLAPPASLGKLRQRLCFFLKSVVIYFIYFFSCKSGSVKWTPNFCCLSGDGFHQQWSCVMSCIRLFL